MGYMSEQWDTMNKGQRADGRMQRDVMRAKVKTEWEPTDRPCGVEAFL